MAVMAFADAFKETWYGYTNGVYRLEFLLDTNGDYVVSEDTVAHPAFDEVFGGEVLPDAITFTPAAEVAAGSYRLIKGGKVSLGIYNQGQLIRTLAAGETQAAGDHAVVWDGLDDQGEAVANGTYQWRLLRNDGLEAEYLISTAGNPPYAPYKMWVGSHGTVGSVTVDVANKRAMVAGTSNENCSAFISWNFDTDEFVWARYQLAGFSFLGGQRMEWTASKLWVLLQNAVLAPLNPTTGVYSANTAIDVIHPSDTREAPGGIGDFLADRSRLPNGLAVHADFIAISHPYHGNIRYHHATTGAYLDRDIDVPNCQSICVMADGTLLVAAGEKIVKVSHPGNVATDFITVSGMNATHVCIDESRDELWIAEGEVWGVDPTPKNRIFRYTLSTGVLQFTLGTEEGRPYGAFEPVHWRNIKDIKCDGYGGIFTVESIPRRTAHWTFSGSTPIIQGQWFGGQQWGNFTATDPADKTLSYCNGSSFDRMLCEIDYATRTWTPVALYESPNWVTHSEGTEETDGPFPSFTQHESQWQVIHRNGKTYMATPIGHAGAKMAVVEVDNTNYELKPVLCAGRVQKSNDTYPAWFLAVYPGTPTANIYLYSWSDLNGDGVLDANEYTFIESPGIAGTGHGFIDDDFNSYWPANVPTPGVSASIGLYLPNSAVNPTDPPIWDWSTYTYMSQTIPDKYVATGRTEISGLTKGADGSVAITLKLHGNPEDDRHGVIWPGNTVGGAKVMRWDKNGNFIYAAGKHGNDNLNGPAEFQVPKRCLGAFKNCVIAQDRRGRQAQAWTDDGLYAGMFFDRYVDDGLPFDEVYKQPVGSLGPEPVLPDQIGNTAILTDEGEVLWNPAGRNTAPIYRINGWEHWERQEGDLTIAAPPAEAVRNGTGIPYEIWTNIDFTGSPAYTGTSAQIRYGNREMNVSTDTSGLAWPYSTHPFSARWTGRVEPIYTEDYQFVIEYTNAGTTAATARLWINGVEQTTDTTVLTTTTTLSQRKIFPAIALTAGEHIEIVVEYTSSDSAQSPNIHLSWQSKSQERRQVPTTALSAIPVPTYSITSYPTNAVIGNPSENFEVTFADLDGPVVVTPASSNAGGIFTPTSVTGDVGDLVKTFTYEGDTLGDDTISFTNDSGLTDPDDIVIEINSGTSSSIKAAGYFGADLACELIAGVGQFQTVDGTAATTDADPVGEWEDRTTNARHFTQGTAGLRPTHQTAELNGLPGCLFDGTDDKIARADFLTGTAGGFMAVIELTTRVSGDTIWSTADTATSSRYIRLSIDGSFRLQLIVRTAGGTNTVRGTTVLAINTPYIVECWSDGTAYKLFVNGNDETLTVSGGSNNGDWAGDMSGTLDIDTLGAFETSVAAANFFDGIIYHAAWIENAQTTARDSARTLLNTIWGVY